MNKYNILEKNDWEKFKKEQPNRFTNKISNSFYLDLRQAVLADFSGLDLKKMTELARLMRGLIFSTVEAGQSGHPGGSSSKVEQLLAMTLSGALAFDPINPKNPGRDRVIWSAGHCTPALYALLSLFYESMRRAGRQFSPAVVRPVFPEDLLSFRKADGLTGHAESHLPLVDFSTGPSGHGFCTAGGLALSHRAGGLDTKVWVIMGDAESEEGMTYEARNVFPTLGLDNLIVSLDYNHIGLDSRIEEVLSTPYLNHWLGLGWNVIEADGANILELIYAYHLAKKGFANNLPTVVIAHTVKGKDYGSWENKPESHGSPINHEEYVAVMKKIGFAIQGEKGKTILDIEAVFDNLSKELEDYVCYQLEKDAELIVPESKLLGQMSKRMAGRPLVDPLSVRRPRQLPKELIFKPGEKVSTRSAAGAWFAWFMKQTAFFYAGAGDVSKSMLTGEAENIYGYVSSQNPYGRGIRFGIAEQNMAMMSAGLTGDVLPGGFHPVSVFGTFAVFSPMMASAVRLAIINNHLNPSAKGFFIMIAGHDGPETGEDGPTHQGLYWSSLFSSYPGIKVYKPTDANETIEMLFYALEKGEPIALSLCRTATTVWDRSQGTGALLSTQGAYVYKPFFGKGLKKVTLVVSGVYLLKNVLLSLPALEKEGYDIKVVVVTSPQLFADLRKNNPGKAEMILSEKERENAIAIHNGWNGFLYPAVLNKNSLERSIGITDYLKSGQPDDLYELANLSPQNIKDRIIKLC